MANNWYHDATELLYKRDGLKPEDSLCGGTNGSRYYNRIQSGECGSLRRGLVIREEKRRLPQSE